MDVGHCLPVMVFLFEAPTENRTSKGVPDIVKIYEIMLAESAIICLLLTQFYFYVGLETLDMFSLSVLFTL